MTQFYVNKYPMKNAVTLSGVMEDIPVGTVFSVVAMDGYGLHFRPVSKKYSDAVISINPQLIEHGFTTTESID